MRSLEQSSPALDASYKFGTLKGSRAPRDEVEPAEPSLPRAITSRSWLPVVPERPAIPGLDAAASGLPSDWTPKRSRGLQASAEAAGVSLRREPAGRSVVRGRGFLLASGGE